MCECCLKLNFCGLQPESRRGLASGMGWGGLNSALQPKSRTLISRKLYAGLSVSAGRWFPRVFLLTLP